MTGPHYNFYAFMDAINQHSMQVMWAAGTILDLLLNYSICYLRVKSNVQIESVDTSIFSIMFNISTLKYSTFCSL